MQLYMMISHSLTVAAFRSMFEHARHTNSTPNDTVSKQHMQPIGYDAKDMNGHQKVEEKIEVTVAIDLLV